MDAKAKPNRARWRPRNVNPKKPGMYECGVRITSSQPKLFLWELEWDGVGFLVPFPMVVHQWRPLAERVEVGRE
jgi:hypothetical protein